MKLFVNGSERRVKDAITLHDLLRILGTNSSLKIAVEHNSRIIPASLHNTLKLSEGDRIEIIQFVGGG